MTFQARNRSSAPASSSGADRPSRAPSRNQARRFASAAASNRLRLQVAADALGLDPLGGLASGTVEEQHRRQAELAREMVDDLDGCAAVVVEESAVRAQHAKLDSETAAVIGAAAFGNHGQVRRRQAPVPRQFVLAGIKGRRHRRSATQGGQRSSTDIEVRALEVGSEVIARRLRVDGCGVE
jgi:hypothetical protein